jgi:excisionase family DNA binding protein
MTVTEAAAYLGIARSTLARQVKAGRWKIGLLRIEGCEDRFSRAALDVWLARPYLSATDSTTGSDDAWGNSQEVVRP